MMAPCADVLCCTFRTAVLDPLHRIHSVASFTSCHHKILHLGFDSHSPNLEFGFGFLRLGITELTRLFSAQVRLFGLNQNSVLSFQLLRNTVSCLGNDTSSPEMLTRLDVSEHAQMCSNSVWEGRNLLLHQVSPALTPEVFIFLL